MRETAKGESTKTFKRSNNTVRHNLNKSKEAFSCGSCGVCSRLRSPQLSSKSASSSLLQAKAMGKESCAVSFMQRNYGNAYMRHIMTKEKEGGTSDPGGSDYSSERYNPTLRMCGLNLSFDGTNLTMTNAGTYGYTAVSGRPDSNGRFDYSIARQKIPNVGPIPEGVYWINPAELWENAWYRRGSRESWGNYRITIHPFTTTQTYGRGGFFIHGGTIPGSAGCIDLTANMDSFVNDMRREMGGTPACQIHLNVDYPLGTGYGT